MLAVFDGTLPSGMEPEEAKAKLIELLQFRSSSSAVQDLAPLAASAAPSHSSVTTMPVPVPSEKDAPCRPAYAEASIVATQAAGGPPAPPAACEANREEPPNREEASTHAAAPSETETHGNAADASLSPDDGEGRHSVRVSGSDGSPTHGPRRVRIRGCQG